MNNKKKTISLDESIKRFVENDQNREQMINELYDEMKLEVILEQLRQICQATIIFPLNDNYFYPLKLLKNLSKIKEQKYSFFYFFRFSFLAASSSL